MIAEVETTTVHQLTPLRAIRKYCVKHCCLDQPSEVRLCPCKDCELYPYRFGHKPKSGPAPMRSPLKAIRARCVDCSAYEPKRVRECPITDCQLFVYRMGKNPALKGKGNASAFDRVNQERRGQVNERALGDEEPAISVQGGVRVHGEAVRS
jgi:hypothetical protein